MVTLAFDDPDQLDDPDMGLMATSIIFILDTQTNLWEFEVWATQEDGTIVVMDSESTDEHPEDAGLASLLLWLQGYVDTAPFFTPPMDMLLKAEWRRERYSEHEIAFQWECPSNGQKYERVRA
jgi:hypothetical protein